MQRVTNGRLVALALSVALLAGCGSALESSDGDEINAASAPIDRQLEIADDRRDLSRHEFVRIADEDIATLDNLRQRIRELERENGAAGTAAALEYLDAGRNRYRGRA